MTTLDLDTLVLDANSHDPGSDRMCVMEAVAMLAGEQWSDHPQCASPAIGAFLRSWNDSLPDDDRQQLKQYIPRLLNSRGTHDQETERSWLATDWLVRVQAPAWLRLAGLTEQADLLASMQPVNPATCPAILPALKAVRTDAAAAWAAAWDAAGDAARDAAVAAARDAAVAAARDAALAATGDAARDAALAAARDAARDAAWAAALAATGAAARDAALAPTKAELQADAHRLVDRMLAVTDN